MDGISISNKYEYAQVGCFSTSFRRQNSLARFLKSKSEGLPAASCLGCQASSSLLKLFSASPSLLEFSPADLHASPT